MVTAMERRAGGGGIFLDLFYLLKTRGLHVSLSEWFDLLEALDKGLAGSSLLEFYYLSRAILVKSEADFDKFDLAFAEYFRGVKTYEKLPKEVLDWLAEAEKQGLFDKDEVDRRTAFDLEKLRKMFEERLKEQDSRHDGGKYWVGTGGTSVFGHSGYSLTGIRVGGDGRNRHALQVAGERNYKDFRDDSTLDIRQFQLAFRRLRQFSARQDGPKDELDLDETISETCDNAGSLRLVFDRPRVNTVKLMILFDSGGSMWPFADLCNMLFQSVNKANHFKDLKIFYFHNCFYERLYKTPECYDAESVETEWILNNLGGDYKVIVVGDASMAPSELLSVGGSSNYYHFNSEPGIAWIRRFTGHYEKLAWFNPLPEVYWGNGYYGSQTIGLLKREVSMFHLSVSGLEAGIKYLIASR